EGAGLRGAAATAGGREGRVGRGAGGQASQRSEGDLVGAVLVFCEADEKGVRSTSLPALTAGAALAKQAGGDLVAVVIGQGVAAAAADAADDAQRALGYRHAE